jgi:hypothetical protein
MNNKINMKNKVLLVVILLAIISCNRKKYKACFTTSKDVYSVNEKVVCKNCSDFDGGFTNCLWDFSDSASGVIYNSGLDSVTYTYTQKGLKRIKLRIGEKENGSEAENTIEIK